MGETKEHEEHIMTNYDSQDTAHPTEVPRGGAPAAMEIPTLGEIAGVLQKWASQGVTRAGIEYAMGKVDEYVAPPREAPKPCPDTAAPDVQGFAPTDRDLGVMAQRFYESSGLALSHLDKPMIVSGLRGVFAWLATGAER